MKAKPDIMCVGGGFGPVTKHGYGIGYFFQGDKAISLHITAFNESQRTNAIHFNNLITESLLQMETVCSDALRLSAAEYMKGRKRLISYKDSLSFSES